MPQISSEPLMHAREQMPLRTGDNKNPVDILVSMWGTGSEEPPLFLRNKPKNGGVLAQQVDPEKIADPELRVRHIDYIRIAIQYLGIAGLDRAASSLNMQESLNPENLRLTVAQVSQSIEYTRSMIEEINILRKYMERMPLKLLPVFIAADICSPMTYPSFETVAGIGISSAAIRTWIKKLDALQRSLEDGNVEYVEAPYLQPVETYMMAGDRELAFKEADFIDQYGINDKFPRELLNLAEILDMTQHTNYFKRLLRVVQNLQARTSATVREAWESMSENLHFQDGDGFDFELVPEDI